ncbi:hypothetical protein [Bacillus alkalicellulosilyticus]|uniref:hypothetical protein n=1 Tax=Alkalihalobacterium alkalicellulosilyticum TaxID=1912214 RepID=UPI0009983116|nr:hypothetical protein [Bacillus alkalicellulosilyticus]
MIKKRIILFFICSSAILFFIFITQSYSKTSSVHEDFPVPKSAKLVDIKDNNIEEYDWAGVKETNGLPILYQLHIKLAGWKESEILGSATRYEKNGEIVTVVLQTDYLSVGKGN